MASLVSTNTSNALDTLVHILGSGKTFQEMRALAFDTVLQIPEQSPLLSCSNQRDSAMPSGATFRLAHQKDIPTICNFRCAQSFEYWNIAESVDTYHLFYCETEAFLQQKLNESIFFAFIEYDGEVVSMSGLELIERLPVISAKGAVQQSATLVACYTPPCHRGKGYMRHMLSAWSFIALMLGIDTIQIETRNESMRRMAQSLGYEHVSNRYRLVLPTGTFPFTGENLCSA